MTSFPAFLLNAHVQLDRSWEQYAETAEPLLSWVDRFMSEIEAAELPDNVEDMQAILQKLKEMKESREISHNAAENEKAGQLFAAFQVFMRLLSCSCS